MAVSKTKQGLNLHVFLAYFEEIEVEDMMLAFVIKQKLMLNKRRHRYWIHEIIKRRKKFGAFYNLVYTWSIVTVVVEIEEMKSPVSMKRKTHAFYK